MCTLERAIVIAAQAHAGQTDKAGAPYILHPLRLMFALNTTEERITAVLHDVIEDSDVTLDALRAEGFSAEILAALAALTKRPDEDSDDQYMAFIRRAAAHPLARRVKMADLADNCDLSRIAAPSPMDFARLEKYCRAIELIRREFESD